MNSLSSSMCPGHNHPPNHNAGSKTFCPSISSIVGTSLRPEQYQNLHQSS